ncbi:MAG: L-2-amino-thiazoline-4-carboxylic acid hydrolase, partial [Oribacterium parvum]|uniref:L-2-amino-thiazoline-4-carboxylic acid hydrolase n=1 Tax=Oribacterium parvum TaxID=1501329 RepID=UPI001CB65B12
DKTWDFHFDEKRHRDGFYYHFTRCPLEKFARENGYLDLLPLCCDIDHIAVERNKGVLHREQTLATGGTICDYWFVGDQTKNPR